MPGTDSVRAGQEKTPPILPFTTQMESDQRLSVCRRDAPNADERFCRRIRPTDDVFGTHNPPLTRPGEITPGLVPYKAVTLRTSGRNLFQTDERLFDLPRQPILAAVR